MKPVHIRGLHSIQIEYTPFAQIELLSYRVYGNNQVRRFILICILDRARYNNENQDTWGDDLR